MLSRHKPFALLWLATAAWRLGVLAAGPRRLNNDEAMLALMARAPEWRLYPFGQAYNGGATLEVYLAWAFGSSKLAPLALSMLALVLLYGWARRAWGEKPALAAAAVYSLLPTLLTGSFQLRGYMSVQVLWIAFLWCAWERRAFLTGLFGGLLIWAHELSLPLVAVGLWRIRSWPALGGLALGYAPALLFNLINGFANWKFLWQGRLSSGGGTGLPPLWRVLAYELPRFFGPDTAYVYLPYARFSGFVFYAFFAAAAFKVRDKLLLALCGLSVLVYASVTVRSPAYLLWLCAPLAVLGGRFAAGRPAVLAALALVAGVETVAYSRVNDIEALAVTPRGLVLRRYSGSDFTRVIELLRAERIAVVWSSPSLQFPLIHESGETVTASGFMPFFEPHHAIIPRYDELVAARIGERPAFVLERDSPLRASAEAWLAGTKRKWAAFELGDFVVLAARP